MYLFQWYPAILKTTEGFLKSTAVSNLFCVNSYQSIFSNVCLISIYSIFIEHHATVIAMLVSVKLYLPCFKSCDS